MSALLSGALYLATGLQISNQGLQDLKRHEGYRETPYLDQAGVLTVCYGSTGSIHPARTYSAAECSARLESDLASHSRPVGQLVAVPLTQGQYDVLVDFVYQFGETKFKHSTLLRKLNAWDCRGAAAELPKWSKVRVQENGKEVLKTSRGVAKRRAENKAIFEAGCDVWEKYGL